MNPLPPTPMDVVAALVWLVLTVLVVSVLVAFVLRMARRWRTPGSSPTDAGGSFPTL